MMPAWGVPGRMPMPMDDEATPPVHPILAALAASPPVPPGGLLASALPPSGGPLSLAIQGQAQPLPAVPADAFKRHGPNWGSIASKVGDAATLMLALRGNPAAAQMLESQATQKNAFARLLAQRQLEEQAYERHRADSNTDWQAHEQWTRDHPGPLQDERVAQAAGYTPGTPQFQAFIKSMHDPVTTIQQGDANTGYTTSYVPRSVLLSGGFAGQAAPPAVLDQLPPGTKPLGGPASAPGTFPGVAKAQIAVESGGRRGVAGPQTPYGVAHGLMQVQDGTAQEMAGKLGVPWRPDLMRGTSDQAAQYQTAIGQAYYQEGLRKYGDPRKALMYYHGGPNEALWGAKTRAYADNVLARSRGM